MWIILYIKADLAFKGVFRLYRKCFVNDDKNLSGR